MTYLSLAKQYRLLFFPNTLARSLVWELKCKLLVLQQYPQKFFILCISSVSFHLCYFRTVKPELIVFLKRHVRTAVRQQSGKWASLNAPNIHPCSLFLTLALQNSVFMNSSSSFAPLASIPLISWGHCTSSLATCPFLTHLVLCHQQIWSWLKLHQRNTQQRRCEAAADQTERQ